MAQTPPNDHQAPEVPGFELVRRIGEGGFGQVWLARNLTTGQLRAVKLIPLRRVGTVDPAGREITSITRLEGNTVRRHPHLLNIDHVGKTAEYLYYVMDPADDLSGAPASTSPAYQPASLQRRLESGPLPGEECSRYARQLLQALASLHEVGMVHRDVKPANCLFVEGRLKLGDFSLLAEADPQVSRLGTQQYMPPDGRMDARADVYAAGLVIYEMLTGLPAEDFPRLENPRETARNPGHSALLRLALRACQLDPRRRYCDAGEMLRSLDALESEAASGRLARCRRALAPMICAFAATLLVLALWRLTHPTTVQVNFFTEPFEATICLDGQPQQRPDGTLYTTPCTVEGVPMRACHVTFRLNGLPDLDVGEIDFTRIRRVSARWDSDPAGPVSREPDPSRAGG